MQVVFHEDFYQEYTSDPAAAAGRMEAIVEFIEPQVEFVRARPAKEEQIILAHIKTHIDFVRQCGLYDISALAAGAAIQAAEIGLESPCFALIRPPGHHASSGSSWGFCYFNNMAIALQTMKQNQADLIAISAGFDNHQDDWGGLLTTEDYYTIGEMVKTASLRCGGGCFGILEGGYNHQVLGRNIMALIQGLSS